MSAPPDPTPSGPRVVVIGAGIVGCALADELTRRGLARVTVLDQGPLFATGGSSSHAPGLVFQTSPSATMTAFAAATVRKYRGLTLDGRPCFRPVGGLEVATTPERAADLRRRHGWALSWGVRADLLSAEECRTRWPMLSDAVLGGLATPDDGLADAVRAAAAQARDAAARGAVFRAHHTVTGVDVRGGRVRGVRTDQGDVPADAVVCAAGFWGPRIGAMAGVPVPLLPLAHQYATTDPLPELTRPGAPGPDAQPMLRHQHAALYVRRHGDRLGIGSYAHRPMPVDLADVAAPGTGPAMPSVRPFTPADYAPSWRDAVDLLPALAASRVADGINGVFSFTPDGLPLLGESREVRGFWLAEAVWVTHSAGAARAVAAWLAEGRPGIDVRECDVRRFDGARLSPAYVEERGRRSFTEVYSVVHPARPPGGPRPLRTSPFHARHRELGAHFTEAGGWERPLWFAANAGLPRPGVPERDPWSARHWSPVAAAEARATRERVALYDMTPLTRIEVAGPGALAHLERLTTNRADRPPGTVVYTLMCDDTGGVLADLTVTRLGPDLFQVGATGPLDLDRLIRLAPDDGSVRVRDTTPGTACVAVWGPRARDLVQPLSRDDFSNAGFPYLTARRAHVGAVPVTALRVSYAGELGWELCTTADLGAALWDTLWEAGRPLGAVAAGRAALDGLRLEKGYRAAGTDMTADHDPYEAGLGFAVRLGKGPFIGRDALRRRAAAAPARRLATLTLDDPSRMVLGGEPVMIDGAAAGHVTSAAFGATIGRPVAHAWLPAAAAAPGTRVSIAYFGADLAATVAAGPLVDPDGTRLRG
ncbi:GcvT family protein [Nocardiopsis trehalosi]|uniref:GcvT family protein n=1 Tax=Nocardiopsis trehalosi TaxID=109329 RepID=UPI00082F0442|nr:FAD-dependent oxidoreductase [Nocardiopsis trehalosi]